MNQPLSVHTGFHYLCLNKVLELLNAKTGLPPCCKCLGHDCEKDRTWNCRFHPTDWWHEVGCPHTTK